MADTFADTAGVSQGLGDLNVMSQTATRQFELGRAQQLLPFELEAAPYTVQNAKATARLHGAQAEEVEQKVEESKITNRVMANWSKGQAGYDAKAPLSEQYLQIASALEMAGAGNKAMDARSRAVIQYSHEQAALKAKREAEAADYARTKDAAAWTEVQLRSVSTPEGWEGVKQAFTQRYKEPPGWANLPYSEQARAAIADQTFTAQQKMDQEWKVEKEKNDQADKRRRDEITMLEKQIKTEQDRRAADAKAAKEKAGGKLAMVPTQREEDAARAIIDEAFEGAEIANKKGMARELALKAKELAIKENLDPETARYRAFDLIKGKLQPDLKKVLGVELPGFLQKNRQKFVGPNSPGGQNNPIPATADTKPQEGMWYKAPDGRVGIYKDGQVRF